MKGRFDMEKDETQDLEVVDLNMTFNGKPVKVNRLKRPNLGKLPVLHDAEVSYDQANDRVVIRFSAFGEDDKVVFLSPSEVSEMMDSLGLLNRLLESIDGYKWDGE